MLNVCAGGFLIAGLAASGTSMLLFVILPPFRKLPVFECAGASARDVFSIKESGVFPGSPDSGPSGTDLAPQHVQVVHQQLPKLMF